MTPDGSRGTARDALFEFQLRVARRADELARVRPDNTALNLHCWLLAERELLNGQLADWLAEPAANAGVLANT